MKKSAYIFLAYIFIVFLVTLAGCKTTEKNYREAYEKAITADTTRTPFEETIYGAQRRAVRNGKIAIDGDTIPMQMIAVSVTADGGGIPEMLKNYCVVAASFKQLFNAWSVRDRLVDGGYPGAFIVQTTEPYYYVLALSTDTATAAVAALRKLQATPPFPLRAPAPFLMLPRRTR